MTNAPAATRQRLMRPSPEGFDIYIKTWVRHTPGSRYAGHWSETRRGRVVQDAGTWIAYYMVGDNPQTYMVGTYDTRLAAAVACDEYAIEQGRILNAQIDYERANGWSTD